ncbi:MAG TPA: lysylphosphatidylglycerol synthase transmembrane domain-containing protein [Pyrinomonadaceae bacterium]
MRPFIKFTALLLLTALLLWWFARGIDWARVEGEMAGTNWLLIAAGVAVVCATYVVRALRWGALLAPVARTSWRELLAATTVGFGAVFLVGRAGEVVRPSFLPLVDSRVSPSASFVTIGVERIYDITAVVVLFAVNLIWFRAPGGDPAVYAQVRRAGFVLLAAAVAGIFALVLFRLRGAEMIGWLDARLKRAPAGVVRVGRFLTDLLEELRRALGVLTDARALAVTVGWTLVLWASIALANWLVLRAFGLPFGAGGTLFVLGFALVGSLVPTPGGAAGAFHVATARGLTFLGVADVKAAAVSIVLHLVVFGPALFLGLYYFLRSDVKLSRLRGVASKAGSGEGEEAAARIGFGPEGKARTPAGR